MWETPSFSLVFLLISLMKVGEITAQCDRPYFEHMVLTDDSGQTSFPEGAAVTFKCAPGYQAAQGSGSRSSTCSAKQWTKPEFQCEKKSCGSPGEIINGKYLTPDGILFGATVTAQCNQGFFLIGVKTRNCRDNGWDGRIPVCEAGKCSPPPEIPNGEYDPIKDEYSSDEAVIYSCKGGFTLIGESISTCSDNKTFHPPPPQCLVIKCDAPAISNAKKTEGKSPPYGYKQFVRYQCNEGYIMNGSDFLTCEVNGWNPSPPVCNAKIEPEPKPEPKPDPKPDPNPDPTHPGSNNSTKIGIGIGVTFVILVIIIGIGLCIKKKSSSWGKVPTRNEGGA